ncbi:hypothetical protein [Amycolatopsis taiwanensis]|uniref:Uncharacterized protein n=1 Tax=Amycolatopsis taiwanensis TaxID=342230 RepID=A0A9W6QWB5_9PSEU|nr:hypothetical protein [Amycolatopsis taiwanensis]GLY63826.1 hypothetical protein Atai01_04450 [Amycolatopsis taiwanensis]
MDSLFAVLLTFFSPARAKKSVAKDLDRIFGGMTQAREWAHTVVASADIDPARYPVRAIRELRAQERRLRLAGAKALVDQLR